jgi:hypothetical protein
LKPGQRNRNPEHASHRGRALYLREASPPRFFSQEFVTISKAKRMVNAAAAYQTERGFERQISSSVSKASKPADQHSASLRAGLSSAASASTTRAIVDQASIASAWRRCAASAFARCQVGITRAPQFSAVCEGL